MTDRAESSSDLRPVGGAARWAVAALVLAGIAWLVRAVWQIRLAAAGQPASGPPDQGDGRHRTLTSLENAYHIVTSIGDVLTVVCALAFLAWLGVVRDNAKAISGQRPRYGWLWVCIGWFVPIANLFVPRGVIADAHRSSAPDRPLPRVVNLWWGLWLVGTLSGVGLMYTASTDHIIERVYSDVWPLLIADVAIVGAAVTGVLVVRALSAAQQAHTGTR